LDKFSVPESVTRTADWSFSAAFIVWSDFAAVPPFADKQPHT
jgi:hypothetical protein